MLTLPPRAEIKKKNTHTGQSVTDLYARPAATQEVAEHTEKVSWINLLKSFFPLRPSIMFYERKTQKAQI